MLRTHCGVPRPTVSIVSSYCHKRRRHGIDDDVLVETVGRACGE